MYGFGQFFAFHPLGIQWNAVSPQLHALPVSVSLPYAISLFISLTPSVSLHPFPCDSSPRIRHALQMDVAIEKWFTDCRL